VRLLQIDFIFSIEKAENPKAFQTDGGIFNGFNGNSLFFIAD
jgi:hypothetical protein